MRWIHCLKPLELCTNDDYDPADDEPHTLATSAMKAYQNEDYRIAGTFIARCLQLTVKDILTTDKDYGKSTSRGEQSVDAGRGPGSRQSQGLIGFIKAALDDHLTLEMKDLRQRTNEIHAHLESSTKEHKNHKHNIEGRLDDHSEAASTQRDMLTGALRFISAYNDKNK